MAAPDPSRPSDPDDLVRHGRFVKALARELARDESEADELAARTMAEAVARRPGAGPSLRAWLRRVLWRIFRRERRDEERRRRQAVDSLVTDSGVGCPAPATVDLVARIELEQTIAAAFAALDEPYKSTLFLRFYDDRTPSQIAAQTGAPVETVKTRLKRGLQRLRERLDAHSSERGARRGEWRAVAIALAKQSGPVAALAKAKGLAAAAVVFAVAGIVTWQVVPRGGRRHNGTSAASAPQPATTAIQVAAETSADDRSAATTFATREAIPDKLPFASGIVVDSAGAPLAGVRVVPSFALRQFDGQWIATPLDLTNLEINTLMTTSADGRFRVANAPKNLAGILFFRPGLIVEEWFELAARREENQDHRVVLVPAGRVHGRVIDTSGRPIPKAFVEVHTDHSTTTSFVAAAAEGTPTCVRSVRWGAHYTHTDDDGRFAIDAVNEVPCMLWVNAAGYGDSSGQRRLVERDSEVEIVLRRVAAALVDVRDAKTKRPVEMPRALLFDSLGSRVEDLFVPYAEWSSASFDPTSDVPGRLPIWCERFKEELKSPGARRDLKLVVFAEGYKPADLCLVLKHEEEPPHESVELEPHEPLSTLSGVVTGASEARLDLRFDPTWISRGQDTQNSPKIAWLQVGPDGRFAFHDLPPATYRIFASAKGCAPVWLDVTAPRDDLAIRFTPSASVVVRVVDHAGATVAGQVVQLQSLDRKRAWRAIAGADGIAHIDELPTGTFDLLVFMPNPREAPDAPARTTDATAFLSDERITLAAGENGPFDVPSLERRPTSLHFIFSDGSAVAGAKIGDLMSMRGPAESASDDGTRLRALDLESDSDGFVDVDLYPGSYRLVAGVAGLKCGATFTVPRRGPDEIEVKLGDALRAGSVHGRVVTAPGGRPIAGWNVGAYRLGRDWESSIQTADAKSAADGSFHLDACPAGSIVVWARDLAAENSNGDVAFASVKLDLSAGATTEVTIPIPRAEASPLATVKLDLTVTSADDGRPVPFVDVLVRATLGGVDYSLISRSVKCDRDGRLSLPLLACDSYHVSLYPPREPHESPSCWQKLELDAAPKDGVVRVHAELQRAADR